MLGYGNGTFASGTNYTLSFIPTTISTGDFNNDGVSDVIATSAADSLGIIYGNANGTFRVGATFSGGGGSATTSSVVASDVNFDGNLDLTVLSIGDSTASVFLGNGDGTFKARVSYSTGSTGGRHRLEDLNGDGVPDLIAMFAGGGAAKVLFGNRDGSFGAANSLNVGTQISLFTLGDFNRDGVTDIAAAIAANRVLYYAGNRTSSTGEAYVNLSSQNKARDAFSALSATQQRIELERGVVGANQSRLAAGLGALAGATESSVQAAGRISDVDIAEASANSARLTILENAAAAVLAHANMSPAIAITLLSPGRR
jgi:flagellin-like hook-associated protein FlgL